jgi:hypothetical protein
MIGLCRKPILASDRDYETKGFHGNVIFPGSMALDASGAVKIYYGAANTVEALAYGPCRRPARPLRTPRLTPVPLANAAQAVFSILPGGVTVIIQAAVSRQAMPAGIKAHIHILASPMIPPRMGPTTPPTP